MSSRLRIETFLHQAVFCCEHCAIFAVQVRERHRVNLLGASQSAGKVRAGEREAGVFGQISLKSQISRHADGGLHRVIGDDANYHDGIMAARSQLCLQIGPDEGAVGALDNDRLAGKWP